MKRFLRAKSKIKSVRALAVIVSRLRRLGRRVVFTNGCFDVLHVGHARYLEAAKQLGDALVVAVNRDQSVRLLKGSGRPLNPERDRAELLSSLAAVDYVVFFGERTPERLICRLRPDVLVKGGDWNVEQIAGGRFVRSYGGKVRTVPYHEGFSSTRLIQKMRPR